MKILDRYVLKQFISTFFFALIAFILLFFIIDLMENLDDFIDAKMNFPLIMLYYLYFIPDIIKLMTPVAALLSALFTTGKLSNLNELVIFRSSGISLVRYLIPFLIVSIFISLFQIYFTGEVIPKANKNKLALEKKYMHKKSVFSDENVSFQDTKNRLIAISFYEVESKKAYKVVITDLDTNNITKITRRIDAEIMEFDDKEDAWKLLTVKERIFEGENIITKIYPEIVMKEIHMRPDDIIKSHISYDEMTNKDLQERIKDEISAGLDPRRTITEYHSRLAFSFASIIVVFFGVPLSVNKRKGGLAVQFGINVLVAFTYIAIMKISQAFGKNGAMNPILTAWFSNILFMIVAIANFIRSNR
jgi:lipopolysaccharide export system permease protein